MLRLSWKKWYQLLWLLVFIHQRKWVNPKWLAICRRTSYGHIRSLLPRWFIIWCYWEYGENVFLCLSFFVLFLSWIQIFSRPRFIFAWFSSGSTIDIFPQVPFIDQTLYLFLELVEMLRMVPISFVELAPTVGLNLHDVCLWNWQLWDFIHVEGVSPYLISMNIQRHEALDYFFDSLEHHLVYDSWHVLTLSWAFNIRGSFFYISYIIFSIYFFSLDVTLHPHHYFSQGCCWPMVEGFIKVSHPEPILKFSYEHFLVWMDYVTFHFCEVVEVLP